MTFLILGNLRFFFHPMYELNIVLHNVVSLMIHLSNKTFFLLLTLTFIHDLCFFNVYISYLLRDMEECEVLLSYSSNKCQTL